MGIATMNAWTPDSQPLDPDLRYPGLEWLGGFLPTEMESWPRRAGQLQVLPFGDDQGEASVEEVRDYLAKKPWVSSAETLFFLCDVHADAEAFLRSLVATGGVAKTGPDDFDFELTAEGRSALFLIGGDCFDKGPRNLRLLRVLGGLIDTGARVEILAGNHDVRTLLGIVCAGSRDPRLAHLFVRMGPKTMTLLREVWEEYLEGRVAPGDLPGDEDVRSRLFPPESWYDEFPSLAREWVPEVKLRKELLRIREKVVALEEKCAELGMTLGMVDAALQKCRDLFVEPSGEFRWFFDRMSSAYRAGSLLFVHAGVDDGVARLIRCEGVDELNRRFHSLMEEEEWFELYHGPVGNSFRTKYRDIDYPFTERGLEDLHHAGVYAVVHGHRALLQGQRMVFRSGLLNFECDASVDRNTRALQGLESEGGAAVVFRPDGRVFGISADHPYVRVFDPADVCELATIV